MAHPSFQHKKSIPKLKVPDSEAEDRELALRTDKALKRIEMVKGKR